MSGNEKRIESPDEIVDILEKIPKFNNHNQKGQGLKLLTQGQMLHRLPFFLAQLKAWSN